jgi:hypothetical protein
MPGYRRAYRTARRAWPLVLAGWRRWEQLSDKEKEQYKQQARRYVSQAAAYARQFAESAPRPGSGKKTKPRRR